MQERAVNTEQQEANIAAAYNPKNELESATFYARAGKALGTTILAGVGIGVVGTCLFSAFEHEQPLPDPEPSTGPVQPAPVLVPPATQPDRVPYELSLPRSEGTTEVQGINAPVTVERDQYGVPRIIAESYEDAVFAQGFVQAQERYFQLDVSRRRIKGELAELLGESAVPSDTYFRRFELKEVAEQVVSNMTPEEKKIFDCFTAGINAGLKDMSDVHPEYKWLNAVPEAWSPEDSVAVYLNVFYALHDNARYEKQLAVMKEALPEELFHFLSLHDSRFEHPVISGDANYRYQPAPIPSDEVVDLRTRERDSALALVEPALLPVGSNNWVIAGEHTHDGEAILASDPHLTISAPNIWHRSHLGWNKDEFVTGVSLAGTPGITSGSNGKIAWGFTNTTADFQDLIIIEVDPENPSRYLTPDGYENFEKVEVEITVKGKQEPVKSEMLRTRWGIVIDRDYRGRPLVMEWTGRHADMINMKIVEMNHASTLEEAYKIAGSWHGPSLNTVIADSEGDIAWIVSGYLPSRRGYQGDLPVSRASGEQIWQGQLPETLRPGVIRPESGRIVTANSRIVDPAWAEKLGNHWSLGVRTERIHQLLDGQELHSEKDNLKYQLDTRVILFDYYKSLALMTLENKDDGDSLRAKQLLEDWNGTADALHPGLRIMNAFRDQLHQTILSPLLAPCRELDPGFVYHWPLAEESVLRILEEKPAHFLPAGYETWEDLHQTVLSRTLAALKEEHPEGLSLPWGEINRASHTHVLASALPEYRDVLNFPSVPLSGHWSSVRVNTPVHGASMRLVVSPGQEEEALLHMPGGQSGHPWSAHYRDGHSFWIQGNEQRLLPGEAAGSFTLKPQRLTQGNQSDMGQ